MLAHCLQPDMDTSSSKQDPLLKEGCLFRFELHFGGPLFLSTRICSSFSNLWILGSLTIPATGTMHTLSFEVATCIWTCCLGHRVRDSRLDCLEKAQLFKVQPPCFGFRASAWLLLHPQFVETSTGSGTCACCSSATQTKQCCRLHVSKRGDVTHDRR